MPDAHGLEGLDAIHVRAGLPQGALLLRPLVGVGDLACTPYLALLVGPFWRAVCGGVTIDVGGGGVTVVVGVGDGLDSRVGAVGGRGAGVGSGVGARGGVVGWGGDVGGGWAGGKVRY